MESKKTIKFRSGLEEHIAEQLDKLGVNYEYEARIIEWFKSSQSGSVEIRTKAYYNPDFLLPNGIFLEGKGQFLTSDRRRHRQIREQFKNKYDIRFIFSNPNRIIGTKSTTRYRDWCDRYGFQWSNQDVPIAWIKERKVNGK